MRRARVIEYEDDMDFFAGMLWLLECMICWMWNEVKLGGATDETSIFFDCDTD